MRGVSLTQDACVLRRDPLTALVAVGWMLALAVVMRVDRVLEGATAAAATRAVADLVLDAAHRAVRD